MKEGKSTIIVIEGTDGSGKATQTKMLSDKLKEMSKQVYTTSFPNYDSDSSALVKMYLNGQIAQNANDVGAKAASIFYAADRYVTYKREMERYYEAGNYTMLFDRYTASNIIHQGAKIICGKPEADQTEQELKEFIGWIDNLEHNDFGIPRADTTIYLRVPFEYTKKLREGRSNKITGGEKQDIHEADTSHLRDASKSGDMAAHVLGWNVVECIKDGTMRSIEDIAEEVFNLVKEKIK